MGPDPVVTEIIANSSRQPAPVRVGKCSVFEYGNPTNCDTGTTCPVAVTILKHIIVRKYPSGLKERLERCCNTSHSVFQYGSLL